MSLTAFSRRSLRTIMGIQVEVASPEDTILSKLRWSEMVGGSHQQLVDVREILRNQQGRLDLGYLQSQASKMELDSILKNIFEESGQNDAAS